MQQCSDFYFLNNLSPQCLVSSRDLLERKVEISSLIFPGRANKCLVHDKESGAIHVVVTGSIFHCILTAFGPGSQEIISKRSEKRNSVTAKIGIYNFFFFFFLNYDLGS